MAASEGVVGWLPTTWTPVVEGLGAACRRGRMIRRSSPKTRGAKSSAARMELPIQRPARMTRAMADRRVLFFSDSLVAGVGDRLGLGWISGVVAASSDGAGVRVAKCASYGARTTTRAVVYLARTRDFLTPWLKRVSDRHGPSW